jgi:leucyl-tRNA synthetase
LYTLFAAPPEKDLEWNEQGIEGCARFTARVFRLIDRHAEGLRGVRAESGATACSAKEKELLRKAHETLRRLTQDFEVRWHFNTSVALVMELVNALHAVEPLEADARPEVIKGVLELLVLMLSPMSPHLCEELWEMLGHSDGLAATGWPAYSAELAAEELVEIPIQINGRMRGKIRVETGLPDAEVVKRALADPKIKPHVEGKKIIKQIVVPDRLVNLVVG